MLKNKRDFFSGIFFLFLGLIIAFRSLQFSVWSRLGPDEGFFPLLISIIIVGVSLLLVTKSVALDRQEKRGKIPKIKKQEVSVFRVVSYGILMILYALLIEPAGFLISTSLFVLIILKYIEKMRWKTSILFSSGVVLLSYLIFDYFLKVPLPKGPITSW